MVSEQDKQQLGEGSTNYVDAAQKTAKAIQEVRKAAAAAARPRQTPLRPLRRLA